MHYNGYTASTMTLVINDLPRFGITGTQAPGDGITVEFTPLPAEPDGAPNTYETLTLNEPEMREPEYSADS